MRVKGRVRLTAPVSGHIPFTLGALGPPGVVCLLWPKGHDLGHESPHLISSSIPKGNPPDIVVIGNSKASVVAQW